MNKTKSYRSLGICELAGRIETPDDVHTFINAAEQAGLNEHRLKDLMHYIASVNHRPEVTKALGEYCTVGCAAHACV